jgi:hypothetical protein
VVDTMIMEDGMGGTNPDSSDQEAIGPGSSFER